MARFRDPPDPLFERLNASIGFDMRLAPYDVRSAHARALRAAGVLDEGEPARMEGPRDGGRGARGRLLPTGGRRGRACRRRRCPGVSGRSGKAPHGSLAKRPGGDRRRALRPRPREGGGELAGSLLARLLELAERHADWPMPGYLHLQRAQPVYLGHHLLAYFWMLSRDAGFARARKSAAELPLGSGALAERTGTSIATTSLETWASTRSRPTRSMAQPGFRARLSRRGVDLRHAPFAPGAEVVLGRARVLVLRGGRGILVGLEHHAPEEERTRTRRSSCEAKAPRITSGFLPRGRDARPAARLLQGPSGGQGGAVRRGRQPRAVFGGGGGCCRKPCASTASGWPRPQPTSSRPRPTSRTCWSARMPFREAHGVVGGLVREALERGKALSELTMRSLAATPSCSTTPTTRRCAPTAGWSRRVPVGGTASARLASSRPPGRASPRSGVELGVLVSRRLEADFLDRSVHDVARDLIGCELLFDGVGGVIVECESYERDDPPATHVGLTARTAPLFGPPGTPTCTSRTGSIPASTSSASRRARRPPC